jgi:hypothetical protein
MSNESFGLLIALLMLSCVIPGVVRFYMIAFAVAFKYSVKLLRIVMIVGALVAISNSKYVYDILGFTPLTLILGKRFEEEVYKQNRSEGGHVPAVKRLQDAECVPGGDETCGC